MANNLDETSHRQSPPSHTMRDPPLSTPKKRVNFDFKMRDKFQWNLTPIVKFATP